MKKDTFALVSLFLPIGLLSLLLTGTACSPAPRLATLEVQASQEEPFQQALQAQLNGNPEQARTIYEDILILQPTNTLVRFQLGMLLLDSLDDPYEAYLAFHSYLRLAPDSDKAEQAREFEKKAKNRFSQRLSSRPEGLSGERIEKLQGENEELLKRISELETELETKTLACEDLKKDNKALLRKVDLIQRQLNAYLGSSTGTIGVGVTSTTTTSAPASKVSRTYEVKGDDTLYNLAQRFYGDGALYTKIREANPDKIGPNGEVHKGDILIIP